MIAVIACEQLPLEWLYYEWCLRLCLSSDHGCDDSNESIGDDIVMAVVIPSSKHDIPTSDLVWFIIYSYLFYYIHFTFYSNPILCDLILSHFILPCPVPFIFLLFSTCLSVHLPLPSSTHVRLPGGIPLLGSMAIVPLGIAWPGPWIVFDLRVEFMKPQDVSKLIHKILRGHEND